MKKRYLVFCGLLISPSNLSFATNKQSSVGVIAVQYEGEYVSIGSGVYVKSQIGDGILTAKHVADVTKSFPGETYICDLNLRKCESIGREYISSSSESIEKDWAFYKKETSLLKKTKSFGKVKIEEEVSVVGMTWGSQPWISKGNVAWDASELFFIDAFCAPGCSGGGVFFKDKLVGVIVAIYNSPLGPQPNQVIAIPIGNIDILKN